MEEHNHHYLPFAERKHCRYEPIDIIVIDSLVMALRVTDNHSSPEIIVTVAHQLERSQVPDEMSGIQLVQVGPDP
ncbi:hypothetical protein M405DRAFT_931170 [Rhizopogon salebrosus TDB-379]|nr:hypothetical protein M405DRAFT_931170 [Rhizopogon salebrosus TDB-379]